MLIDEFRFGTTYASVAPVETKETGAPCINIQRAGADVQISWPSTAGFLLETTESLGSGPWVAACVGNPVTSPTSAKAQFFRLKK